MAGSTPPVIGGGSKGIGSGGGSGDKSLSPRGNKGPKGPNIGGPAGNQVNAKLPLGGNNAPKGPKLPNIHIGGPAPNRVAAKLPLGNKNVPQYKNGQIVGSPLVNQNGPRPPGLGGAPGGGPATHVPVIPNWLAPQSQQALVQQATNTIGSSYTAANMNLDQQQKQLLALNDKRMVDNQYYLNWLDSHAAGLQSQTAAANAMLGGVASTQNTGTPIAPGSTLSAPTGTNGSIAATDASLGNQAMTSARANDFAYMGQIRAKQMTDLQTALTGINNSRNTLVASEHGDITKEVSRLQGVEIAKAQSTRSYDYNKAIGDRAFNQQVLQNNRSFDAAIQKLNLVGQGQQLTAQSKAAQRALQKGIADQRTATTLRGQNITSANDKAKNTLALTKTQLDQANKDRQYNLDKAKYGSSVAKDNYQRAHGLGSYRVPSSGRGSGPKPLTQTSQNSLYGHVSTTQGELRQLIDTGMTPQQAYHALLNGRTVSVPTGRTTSGGKPIYHTQSYHAADPTLLNAAYNIQTGNGLTPGDVKALKQLGLSNPGSRYKLSAGPHLGGIPAGGIF